MSSSESMRAIVSVLGSDRPGIVASVSKVLSDAEGNILDISQTILQGTFTMTMLVDLANSNLSFAEIQQQLSLLAEELGVQIVMQKEEVFQFMHRL